MFPGGGNMNQMMKQVQKMQQNVAKMQAEIAARIVEGSAGGGAIKVTVTGDKAVKSITISPEVVDADDVEMLQDMILAAINDAMNRAEEMADAEMKKVMPAGMPKIPGLF